MTIAYPRIILGNAVGNVRPDRSLWDAYASRAAKDPRKILLPEAEEPRVLSAACFLAANKIALPVLVGDRTRIEQAAKESSFSLAGLDILDHRRHNRFSIYAEQLFERRRAKGLTEKQAKGLLEDPLYFSCMAMRDGLAHGVVAGATRTTADTVRAGLSCLGLAKNTTTLFGLFLMECPHANGGMRRLVFADAAVSPHPSVRALAAIGIESAKFYERFVGKPARVAYLSFSTRSSASDESVDLVRQAVTLVRQKSPALSVDGELQGDAALVEDIALQKGAADSDVTGKANVLVFPDLNAANISYKLVQHLGGCRAVGPFLMGLATPMSDLSRGCTDEDIVDAAAIVSLLGDNE